MTKRRWLARDRKRKQREKGKRLRGNQRARLWDYLRRNKFLKANTMRKERR